MIIIAAHAVFGSDKIPVHGTGSAIGEWLQEKTRPFLFIYHSLYGDYSTYLDDFSGKKLTHRSYGFKKLPLPLRIFQDQILSFYFIYKAKKKIKIFIGIDPLNAFSGILAKKLGLVEKTVFYTADYAHRRFENFFLNWFYHWLDLFVVKNVDQVWNVSTRITEQRTKQGVPDQKNFFIPNAPVFKKIKRLPISRVNWYDLVIVTHVTRAVDWDLLFKVIENLVVKYKELRLLVIGTGPEEKKLKRVVRLRKMERRVLFLGQKSHDEALRILARSGVGVAIYTKEQPWREFCDSLKIREYFACGLPVITTDVSSTASEVKNEQAGFVIDLNEKELERAINELFSNKQLRLKMRRNGIKLAKRYDFSKVIDEVLVKLND